jgi:ribosomal protein L22
MIDEPEKPDDVEETPAEEAEEPAAAAPETEEAVADEAPADEAPAEVAEEPVAVADESADDEADDSADDSDDAASEDEAPAEPAPAASTAAKPARAAKPKPALARDGEVPVVRAQAKYVRTSARKARIVCDHLRGKSVEEARAILATTNRNVAEDWKKLLESAVANAEHNHELLGDDLKIHAVFADEGPTLKRFRPRAMGRATKIMKRTSHLTIALTPKE